MRHHTDTARLGLRAAVALDPLQAERQARFEAIQARLKAQEEENKRLAAERKRKLEELQQKVRARQGSAVPGTREERGDGSSATAERRPCS